MGGEVMRITNSMYYKGVFSPNKNRISQSLFDVNKQISSGLKIEYAKDDVSVFSDTMRLDNEIATLEQAKSSTTSALKISTQTDKALNDFQTTLDRMRVLMVNAANASHNDASLDAVYNELKGLRDHLVTLSNTSINGKYLFSGSAFDTKPMDASGKYHGNDKTLEAFAGSNVKIQYNIPGSELFLGEESQRHRHISTNIKNLNQSELHPDIMKDPLEPADVAKERYITENDTIRDLMGDVDNDPANDPQSHFYIKGIKHNGQVFYEELTFNSTQKVGELLDKISDLYGHDSVDVTLNQYGQIEVKDKIPGSSKLDFHMFGAVDFNLDGNNTDDAGGKTVLELENSDVVLKGFTNSNLTRPIDKTRLVHDPFDAQRFSISGKFIKLQTNEVAHTDTLLEDALFDKAKKIRLSGTDTQGNGVSITYNVDSTKTIQDLMSTLDNEFDQDDSLNFYLDNGKIKIESSNPNSASNLDIRLETLSSNSTNVKGFGADAALVYDKEVYFDKKGSKLLSNTSQIVREDNSYATPKTKLSEVANLSDNNQTLDGEKLVIKGKNVNGEYIKATIDFSDNGTTFTLKKDLNSDGNYQLVGLSSYSVFNNSDPRQATAANDVTYQQLNDVINMVMADKLPATNTADDYDKAIEQSSSYAKTQLDEKGRLTFEETGVASTKSQLSVFFQTNNEPGLLSFQKNASLSVTDPKTDFFAQLDEAIEAVGLGRTRADGDATNPRNVGIQNGIQIIDDLSAHVTKVHTKIGSLSKSLQNSADRSELLSISTQTLRSDVLDTDIAEASLKLNQLTLNYQAILSTIGRVSKLSLVNYL